MGTVSLISYENIAEALEIAGEEFSEPLVASQAEQLIDTLVQHGDLARQTLLERERRLSRRINIDSVLDLPFIPLAIALVSSFTHDLDITKVPSPVLVGLIATGLVALDRSISIVKRWQVRDLIQSLNHFESGRRAERHHSRRDS